MSDLQDHARPSAAAGVDPRGPQFNAAVTVVVLLAILLTPTPVAIALTVLQALFFAVGTVAGVSRTPHAWVFRTWIRPRLAPPADLEDPRPPRFAQTVGLAFMVVALIGFAVGVPVLAQAAVGLALVAALLNAVFRFCLGCELYLLFRRLA